MNGYMNVDDLLGAEEKHKAWRAYHDLTQLLDRLRIETAPDKQVPSTMRLEFLEVTFDSNTMMMELPSDKIEEIISDLKGWLYRDQAKRREVESLVGKLQFASKCIRQDGCLWPE